MRLLTIACLSMSTLVAAAAFGAPTQKEDALASTLKVIENKVNQVWQSVAAVTQALNTEASKREDLYFQVGAVDRHTTYLHDELTKLQGDMTKLRADFLRLMNIVKDLKDRNNSQQQQPLRQQQNNGSRYR